MMRLIRSCRICRSQALTQFLDLGHQPPANAFLAKEAIGNAEPIFPLRVLFCQECGLSQLGEVVSPEVLFRDYVYLSAAMPGAEEHWGSYAREVMNRFLKPGDFVVEIGSNDGLLLGFLQELGSRVLGVDPAKNIAEIANARGVKTIPDFFNEKLAQEIRERHGSARTVLANNVVAHIDDHHDLMAGVRALLDDAGVFIFEAPYLLDLVEGLRFDSIYHEHLSYLSARPLERLLGSYGMEMFDAKLLPVQGTSLRAYASQSGRYPISPQVGELLEAEQSKGLDRLETYTELGDRIEQLKTRVVSLLRDLKTQGKRIAAYGAPARGNVLLNYFGIGPDLLDYATEELETKIGRYLPGTHIPVISIAEARKNPPDYYLMLAWNYRDAILEKEREFRARGGKFIVPVGDVEIV